MDGVWFIEELIDPPPPRSCLAECKEWEECLSVLGGVEAEDPQELAQARAALPVPCPAGPLACLVWQLQCRPGAYMPPQLQRLNSAAPCFHRRRCRCRAAPLPPPSALE